MHEVIKFDDRYPEYRISMFDIRCSETCHLQHKHPASNGTTPQAIESFHKHYPLHKQYKQSTNNHDIQETMEAFHKHIPQAIEAFHQLTNSTSSRNTPQTIETVHTQEQLSTCNGNFPAATQTFHIRRAAVSSPPRALNKGNLSLAVFRRVFICCVLFLDRKLH